MTKLIASSLFAFMLSLLLAQSASAQPVVCYNPATGNITFDGFRGVNSIRIHSSGGHLIPNVRYCEIGLCEKTSTLYSWLDFGAGISGDGLNAGNFVVPGKEASDLKFDYKIGLGGPLRVGHIKVVPEPGTMLLASLGMLVLAVSRRH